MNSFADHMAADRRHIMLRVLLTSVRYTSNANTLQSMTARLGYPVSLDRVQTDVAWMTEQGLVTSETVGGLVVVTMTARGQEVAQGFATVPGVARPRAGEV